MIQPSPRPARSVVLGALALVQVFFGLQYIAAKLLLQYIPARAWACLRVMAAAAILLAVVRLSGRRLPARGDLLRLAGLSLLGVVINQLCFIEGLARTTPAHSSVLITAIPVGTLLFGILLRQESLTGARAVSLLMSLAGVWLVLLADVAPGGLGGLLVGDTLTGDVLTLINALSFALFLVLSKRLVARVDPLVSSATVLMFGSLGMLAAGGRQLISLDFAGVPPRVWGLGAFIVIFPTVLAYVLMYWALKWESSFVVALFIYLQPLIATALSAWWFDERPAASFYLGGVLIFTGVYLAVRPGPPRAP